MKFLEVKDHPFTVFINIENITSAKFGNNTGHLVIWMINNESHNFEGELAREILFELKKNSALIMKDEHNTVSNARFSS